MTTNRVRVTVQNVSLGFTPWYELNAHTTVRVGELVVEGCLTFTRCDTGYSARWDWADEDFLRSLDEAVFAVGSDYREVCDYVQRFVARACSRWATAHHAEMCRDFGWD